MRVTVDVAGGDTHDVDLPADATYADCCDAVDLSIHEASVLVDGRPVPEDQPVEADAVTVVRLVKGGSGSAATDGDPTVRAATDAEATTARSVLDAAMLEADDFDARLAANDVLVALIDDRIVGAAVRSPHGERAGAHVEAIAVRPNRRGQGIGEALVEAVADDGPVTAEFDGNVRPFYESLGFSIRGLDEGRFRGVLEN